MIRIISSSPYIYSDFDSPQRDRDGYIMLPLDDLKIAIKRITGKVRDIRLSATNSKEVIAAPEGNRIDSWAALVVGDIDVRTLEKVGAKGIGAWTKRGFGRFEVKEC